MPGPEKRSQTGHDSDLGAVGGINTNVGQVRKPRLAELIADKLRRRITSGAISDGTMLPKLEALLAEFQVSKPTLREALRILETEGLITVVRGNVGGAVIHAPGNRDAGYMIGLVLESRNVTMGDLAVAIRRLEPTCAALCAQRSDRNRVVLPQLRALNDAMRRAKGTDIAFAKAGRDFHEAIVALSGNETMKLVLGALEAVWSAHTREWARQASRARDFPTTETQSAGLKTHDRLIELIERGDAEGSRRDATRHLESSTRHAVFDSNATIKAIAVRDGG